MGANVDNGYDEPITLCAVLNGLRQQRVKHLTLNYESHLGETVQIAVKRSKGGNACDGSSVVNVTNIIHEPSEPPHSNS